jgi:hypothetical protein
VKRRQAALAGAVSIVLTASAGSLAGHLQGPRAAIPIDAADAILGAFRAHAIVMLGHPHGNEQKYAFQISLIRDPRFAAVVNDIVEECGNSRYQGVIDRFVDGEDVPRADLKAVWENTTSANTNCDRPMYEELYRVVRSVNATLPKDRRVRVLLGDPPIDWAQVRSFADIAKWGDQRDTFPAQLIQREVLAKGRRALVLYGEMHAERRNERVNFETADLIAGILEAGGTKVFTIWPNLGSGKPELSTLQPDAATWPVPSLVIVSGTILGAHDFSAFLTSDGRLERRDGKLEAIPRERWKPMRMEDQFDAILYLGPGSASSYQRLSRERCADREYLAMRIARMALVPGGEREIDQLKRFCASPSPMP